MSKKVKIKIDGKTISCNEGKTVLDVALENNIFIPSLCAHPDLSIKANCRVCVVEIKGDKKLSTACSRTVVDGMEIKTESSRVKQARNLNIELLFAEHIERCGQCIWRVNCRLLDLAQRYKIKITKFKDRKGQRKVYKFANAVEIDGTQCIDCRNCVEACSKQGVDYLEISGKGIEQEITPTKDKNKSCIYCGQCALHCPVGAAQESSAWEAVDRDLDYKEKIVVAQISPAARISIGEEFGFPAGDSVTGKIISAMRQLGFSHVFDMTIGSDLSAWSEAQKISMAFAHINRPIITSTCPAGVQYIKSFHPYLSKNIIDVKSPQIIHGNLIKKYWSPKNKIDPRNVIVVSVVPCTAQKHEADQVVKDNGLFSVDYVLTVRELAWMIKRKNIDLAKINSSKFDFIDDNAIGNATAYETSGGQAQLVSRLVFGDGVKKVKIFDDLIGSDGARELFFDYNGKRMKMAVINGTGNASHILDGYKDYDYIEIMACPSACAGGGGQAIPTDEKRRVARASFLRKTNKGDKMNKELLNKYRMYF